MTTTSVAGSEPISNHEDMIDSRTINERIDYLEDRKESDDPADELDEWESHELEALRRLADDCDSTEWEYGVTLVRDEFFEEYAQQTAEDLGLIPHDAAWPACHIDWEAAADALKMDYTNVEYDGVTYWFRA